LPSAPYTTPLCTSTVCQKTPDYEKGEVAAAWYWLAGWVRSANYIFPSRPVTTWVGDCLYFGTPSRYVASHLGQLSLPSLRAS